MVTARRVAREVDENSGANVAAGSGAAVRVLGIDPGTQVVGFGCIEVAAASSSRSDAVVPLAQRVGNSMAARPRGGTPTVVEVGVFRLGGRKTALEDRLCALAEQLDALIQRLAPHELALEEAFAGKSIQSAMRIGEARGVVLAGARRRRLVVSQFPPARIKRVVTGNGNATKEAVARMVAGQLGLRTIPQPADATDALAVALCRVEFGAAPSGPASKGARLTTDRTAGRTARRSGARGGSEPGVR